MDPSIRGPARSVITFDLLKGDLFSPHPFIMLIFNYCRSVLVKFSCMSA